MPSLDENETNAIIEAFDSDRVSVWSIAVTKLYKAQQNQWNYTGVTGVAVMLSEDNFNYIRILDLKTKKVLFEQELYDYFEYHNPTTFFHTFETNNFVAGLSFADEEEADVFYQKVIESIDAQQQLLMESQQQEQQEEYYEEPAPTPAPAPVPVSTPPAARVVPTQPKPQPPPTSTYSPPPQPVTQSVPPPTPTASQPPPLQSQNSLDQLQLPMKATPIKNPLITQQAVQQQAAAKKSGTSKKGFLNFGKKTQPEPHRPVIGAPTDFKHESHIGWDPVNGFEIRNIPPEWKKLFQNAGITKKELKDAETAKFIMTTVVETISTGAGPPPPPPPPPPPGAPAPPPAAVHKAAPAAGGGGGGGGAMSLLDQIKAGKELKKVEEAALPDLTKLDESSGNFLAETLAAAMAARRGAIQTLVDSDEEQNEEDEDWN